MYTHAYQSFVWNMVASDRVSKFARNAPVVGDLVIPHDATAAALLDGDFVGDDDAASTGDATSAPADERPATTSTERPSKKPKRETAALEPVVVTADNIAQYSIYDVVLPLPGYDVAYPANELCARYDELLRADNVDFGAIERATNSEYHLPGSYRHVLKKPLRVSHEIKRYDDPTIPLLATDVDVLEGTSVQASIPDAKFRALCLEFELSTSLSRCHCCCCAVMMMHVTLDLTLSCVLCLCMWPNRSVVVRDDGCARAAQAEQQPRRAAQGEGRRREQRELARTLRPSDVAIDSRRSMQRPSLSHTSVVNVVVVLMPVLQSLARTRAALCAGRRSHRCTRARDPRDSRRRSVRLSRR